MNMREKIIQNGSFISCHLVLYRGFANLN